MANEEILRLRTTAVTDEGLAKIRAFGNEFAQMPKKVGAPLKDLNTIFGTLSGTIKKSFVDRRNPDAAIYLTTDEGSSPEIQLEEGQRCIEWTCSRPRKCPGVPRLLTTKQICGGKMQRLSRHQDHGWRRRCRKGRAGHQEQRI